MFLLKNVVLNVAKSYTTRHFYLSRSSERDALKVIMMSIVYLNVNSLCYEKKIYIYIYIYLKYFLPEIPLAF